MKKPFEERGNEFLQEEKKLQVKYGVERHAQLIFPKKKVIPLRGRFALYLLRTVHARIVDGLKDVQRQVKKGKRHGNT